MQTNAYAIPNDSARSRSVTPSNKARNAAQAGFGSFAENFGPFSGTRQIRMYVLSGSGTYVFVLKKLSAVLGHQPPHVL
jgi:hypothetical protein